MTSKSDLKKIKQIHKILSALKSDPKDCYWQEVIEFEPNIFTVREMIKTYFDIKIDFNTKQITWFDKYCGFSKTSEYDDRVGNYEWNTLLSWYDIFLKSLQKKLYNNIIKEEAMKIVSTRQKKVDSKVKKILK